MPVVKKGKKFIRPMKSEIYSLSPNERTLLYYRMHPVQAAQDLLDIKLNWFQRIIIRDLWFKPFNLLCMGRGASKTFCLAVFCILWGILYPYQKILALGPSKRQGDYIFAEIDDIFAKSEYFQASVKRRVIISPTENKVNFTNNSIIRTIPIGPGGKKIRGARAHVMALDEYAQFDKEIVDLVIRPFLAIRKKGQTNKLIISSSAYYKWNHFWDMYVRYRILTEKDPKNYSVNEYDYRDILLDKSSPFEPDMTQVNEAKENMTETDFRMEWERCFPLGENSYFPAYLIDSCTPKPPKEEEVKIEKKADTDDQYIAAVDCAREEGGSNFAIGIGRIRNRVLHVVKIITLNGETYQKQVQTIRQALLDFPIELLLVDKGGGGLTIKDLLAEPWKEFRSKVVSPSSQGNMMLPVLDKEDKDQENLEGLRLLQLVDFHGSKHSNLYINLKAEMEHGRVKFPINLRRDRDKELELIGQNIIALKRELAVLETKAKGVYLHFYVPKRFRSDRAAVLAMLADGFIGLTKVFKEKEKATPKLATGFFLR